MLVDLEIGLRIHQRTAVQDARIPTCGSDDFRHIAPLRFLLGFAGDALGVVLLTQLFQASGSVPCVSGCPLGFGPVRPSQDTVVDHRLRLATVSRLLADAFRSGDRVLGLLLQRLGQIAQHQLVVSGPSAVAALAARIPLLIRPASGILQPQIDDLPRLQIAGLHERPTPFDLPTSVLQSVVGPAVLPLDIEFLAIHRAEGIAGVVLFHHIVEAVGRDGQLGRTISRVPGQELILVLHQTRWPDVAIRFEPLVPRVDRLIEVDPLTTRVHAVEAVGRVIQPTVQGRAAIPRGETHAGVLVAVVVSIVKIAALGSHEQVDQEARHVDRVARLVARRTTVPIPHQRSAEPHRREQRPAPGKPVVPVPGHIHAPAGSPVVLIGDPHIVLLAGHVVPRRPLVIIGGVGPVPRHPHLIVTRRRNIRPDFQRGGRLRDIG